MKLTALENQVKILDGRIKQLEACGLDRCDLIHELRVLISIINTFQAQVKRASLAIKEGKLDLAQSELGDVQTVATQPGA